MTNIFEILSKHWVFIIASEQLIEHLEFDAKQDLFESKPSLETYSSTDWDKDDGLDF